MGKLFRNHLNNPDPEVEIPEIARPVSADDRLKRLMPVWDRLLYSNLEAAFPDQALASRLDFYAIRFGRHGAVDRRSVSKGLSNAESCQGMRFGGKEPNASRLLNFLGLQKSDFRNGTAGIVTIDTHHALYETVLGTVVVDISSASSAPGIPFQFSVRLLDFDKIELFVEARDVDLVSARRSTLNAPLLVRNLRAVGLDGLIFTADSAARNGVGFSAPCGPIVGVLPKDDQAEYKALRIALNTGELRGSTHVEVNRGVLPNGLIPVSQCSVADVDLSQPDAPVIFTRVGGVKTIHDQGGLIHTAIRDRAANDLPLASGDRLFHLGGNVDFVGSERELISNGLRPLYLDSIAQGASTSSGSAQQGFDIGGL